MLAAKKPTVRIIGFPMDLGSGRRGVDMGPSALRIAGVGNAISSLGYNISDHGDIVVQNPEVHEIGNPKLRYLPIIESACEKLAAVVTESLDKGEFPLVLGGDHSMAMGTIAGIASHCKKTNKRLGVIWIDAHADMNTAETTPSGNIHGMPLAASMGIGDPALTGIAGSYPKVDPERVIIIGLRSIDPEERELIKKLKILALTMSAIDKFGMATIIAEALAEIHQNCDHLHVSFDLDSVDPMIAPGVGTPVPGGLTYREAHLIMEAIADTGLMSSLEVAEVNPILDVRNASSEVAVGLIASAMGKKIL